MIAEDILVHIIAYLNEKCAIHLNFVEFPLENPERWNFHLAWISMETFQNLTSFFFRKPLCSFRLETFTALTFSAKLVVCCTPFNLGIVWFHWILFLFYIKLYFQLYVNLHMKMKNYINVFLKPYRRYFKCFWNRGIKWHARPDKSHLRI